MLFLVVLYNIGSEIDRIDDLRRAQLLAPAYPRSIIFPRITVPPPPKKTVHAPLSKITDAALLNGGKNFQINIKRIEKVQLMIVFCVDCK